MPLPSRETLATLEDTRRKTGTAFLESREWWGGQPHPTVHDAISLLADRQRRGRASAVERVEGEAALAGVEDHAGLVGAEVTIAGRRRHNRVRLAEPEELARGARRVAREDVALLGARAQNPVHQLRL